MKQNLRESIIHTGIQQFGQYGYDTVSLREIAFNAGISMAELEQFFQTKEDLMLAIIEYIPTRMEHYTPSRESIKEQLNISVTEDILLRFITNYSWSDDYLQQNIYRLLFMEQYSNPKIRALTRNIMYEIPSKAFQDTLEYLIELKKIPPCDVETISQLWTSTWLVYAIYESHDKKLIDTEEYFQVAQFFIEIIVRGVPMIPAERIEMKWDTWVWEEREEDCHEAKYIILQAALDLFSEKGYVNVSIRDIAHALDMELEEIYLHYRSKSDIMKTIVTKLLNGYERYKTSNPAFQAVLEGDTMNVILTLATFYPPLKEQDVLRLYRILFREQYFNEDLRDLFFSSNYRDRKLIETLLDEMIAAGKIRPCKSKEIAIAQVYSMCAITVSATIFEEDSGYYEAIRIRIVSIFISLIVFGYMDEKK